MQFAQSYGGGILHETKNLKLKEDSSKKKDSEEVKDEKSQSKKENK